MPPAVQPQTSPSLHPLAAYEECVRAGKLKNDEGQRQVSMRLQALHESLMRPSKGGLLSRMLGAKQDAAKSIYIWGAVGRGKSLLMDMFYDTLNMKEKRRIHFHAFMQEVHALSHRWRQEIETKQLKVELLEAVAGEIATGTKVLCLDELQVTDVADAMIVSKLFTVLLDKGTAVVITSNRPPEELYLGGLQREKFMDFVHLVYHRMEVLQLVSPHDYRLQQIRAMQAVYMWPLTPQAEKAYAALLAELTHQSELSSLQLDVRGHTLTVPAYYGGIAAFAFADLCEKALGAGDYLAIAKRFHTVFLKNLPQLSVEKRNESRRFVTLIDTLYDHRVKLICTAEVEPARLYPSGDGAFEFQRTVSRLIEMQSEQYLNQPHIA